MSDQTSDSAAGHGRGGPQKYRLARFVCGDCGRDWKQYTREGKDVPCISCWGENIKEVPVRGA